MKRLLTASVMLVVLVVLVGSSTQSRSTALAAYHGSGSFKQASQITHRHWCIRTFRVQRVVRVIQATYRGTKNVSRYERRRIAGMENCLRDPIRTGYVLKVNRHARHAWSDRRHPMGVATASQYDDAGTHCCGYYAHYGVAVCGSSGPCVSMGTKIRFCYPWKPPHRCVIARADDHGPYVAGRSFDLSDITAAAIGFSGVDSVAYRIGG